MIDYIRGIALLLGCRIVLFSTMVLIIGGDPNRDTALFAGLADTPLLSHWQGEGAGPQFPLLSPLFFSALQWLHPEHWLRIALITADVTIYSLMWWRIPAFRKSWCDRAYVIGVFTAPLSAVWGQDELFAVIPLVIASLWAIPGWIRSIGAVASFLILKNFYLFVPATYWRRAWRLDYAALGAIAAMLVLDRSGDFVPGNAFTSSIWYFSPLSDALSKTTSLALFAAIVFYPLLRYAGEVDWRFLSLWVFGCFFNFFYHVNFEYFVFLTLPALVLFYQRRLSGHLLMLLTGWFGLAVASNVAYALAYTQFSVTAFEWVHAITITGGFGVGLLALFSIIFAIRREAKGPC